MAKRFDTGAGENVGRLEISPTAIAQVAQIAARETQGVHELGSGGQKAGGAKGRAGGDVPGVSVEVGEIETAIDIDIVAEYGTPITEIAERLRRNVADRVRDATGLIVAEVNIAVRDIYIPGNDSG